MVIWCHQKWSSLISLLGFECSNSNQLLLDTPRIGSCVRTVQIRIPHKPQFDILTDISSILQERLLQKGTHGGKLARAVSSGVSEMPVSMEELSMEYVINFPLSALKDCKPIKTLKLRNWKHDPKFKVTRDTLVHALPPIESLSIHSYERKFLQKMLPWLEKRNIVFEARKTWFWCPVRPSRTLFKVSNQTWMFRIDVWHVHSTICLQLILCTTSPTPQIHPSVRPGRLLSASLPNPPFHRSDFISNPTKSSNYADLMKLVDKVLLVSTAVIQTVRVNSFLW